MTKVIDLTKPQGDEVKKKPIEFVGCITADFKNNNFELSVTHEDFVEIKRVLAKGVDGYKYDLFRCETEEGIIVWIFGHFNDGVV
jgi:hypothetical protein